MKRVLVFQYKSGKLEFFGSNESMEKLFAKKTEPKLLGEIDLPIIKKVQVGKSKKNECDIR